MVVTGKLNERAIAHAFIEKLGPFVPGAHFQGNLGYARYDGAFL